MLYGVTKAFFTELNGLQRRQWLSRGYKVTFAILKGGEICGAYNKVTAIFGHADLHIVTAVQFVIDKLVCLCATDDTSVCLVDAACAFFLGCVEEDRAVCPFG